MADVSSPYGNGPQNLPPPVPSAGQSQPSPEELAAAFAQQSQQPQQAQASPNSPEALAASFAQGQQAPEAQAPQEAPGIGSQILDKAGRVLDYGGGAARTVAADVYGKLSGKKITSDADFDAAIKGQAPSVAEYLKRAGVGEGGSFNVPGIGKVTARGAAGLAGDIASGGVTNELKLLGTAFKQIPYLRTLVGAPGKAADALGEAVYKSAVSGVDAKLAERGSGSVGQALIENGAPVGGVEKLAQKVQDVSNTMGKIRQGLYDKATELGASIDTAFPMKRAEAVLGKMRSNPGLAPAADQLQNLLTDYQKAGKVSLEMMSDWKTQLYDSLPASAFDAVGKVKGPAKQFKAALAGDFRDAIVHAGNKAQKGLGDAVNTLNDKWGTLLSAQPLLGKAASGGNLEKSLGHTIDSVLVGSGHLPVLAMKKSYDLATTPYAKTLVGNALMKAGSSGFADAVARRGIVDAAQAQRPPAPPMAPAEEPQQ